jgi:hypothetical protein
LPDGLHLLLLHFFQTIVFRVKKKCISISNWTNYHEISLSAPRFCFSALVGVLAAICSAGSAAMTAIESSKINSNDIDHPCALLAIDQTINCELWFDLEVAVAALSVLSFILSVTLFIVIMAGSSKSKVFELKLYLDVSISP